MYRSALLLGQLVVLTWKLSRRRHAWRGGKYTRKRDLSDKISGPC